MATGLNSRLKLDISDSRNRVIGLDIETIGTNAYLEDTRLHTVCWYGEYAGVVTKGFWQPIVPGNETIPPELLEILSDPEVVLCGHNIGTFDTFFLEGWNDVGQITTPRLIPDTLIKCRLFDTLVAQSLIDENSPNNLNALAKRYFGEEKLDLDARKLTQYSLEDVLAYCEKDTELSFKLYDVLVPQLLENGQKELFEFQMEVIWTIINIQRRGMCLDVDFLEDITKEYQSKCAESQKKLQYLAGRKDFNPRSPKQLGEIIYDEFQMPILPGKLGRTKTGNPSTSVQTINQFVHRAEHWKELFEADINPELYDEACKFLSELLVYRRNYKSLSTYFLAFRDKYLCIDNTVRPSFYLGKGSDPYSIGVFGTATGRLSSRDPNLQNVSNNPDIRRCFIPSPGFRLFSVDYSQLEVRVAGFVSEDEKMLEAFANGLDLHTLTLTYVYPGNDYDAIVAYLETSAEEWKARRKLIKPFNFGLIYGASPWTLQSTLLDEQHIWIDIEEIKDIAYKWKNIYSGYGHYQDVILEVLREVGEVETYTRRRRRFPEAADWDNLKWGEKSMMHRQAVNSTIQGLASDITIFALHEIANFLNREGCGYLLATVHDSIEGEYHPDRITAEQLETEILRILKTAPINMLENVFNVDTTKLYLEAEFETLDNWAGI